MIQITHHIVHERLGRPEYERVEGAKKREKDFNFKSIIIFINHTPAINLSLCLSERSIIRSI